MEGDTLATSQFYACERSSSGNDHLVQLQKSIFTNTLEQLAMFSIGHTSEHTVRNTSDILISTFSCRYATEGCCQEGISGLTKPTVVVVTRRDSGVRTTRTGEASTCP